VPWPVYSTRFVWIKEPAGQKSYTVPIGHVAVVKNVVARSYLSTAEVWLSIAGVACWVWVLSPAASAGRGEQLHQVAYGGEIISLQTAGTGVAAMVSGFLFQSPPAHRSVADGADPPVQLMGDYADLHE